MIEVLEHESPSYGPRTAANARSAEATLAFAINFDSAGERLTKKVAGTSYLAVPLSRAADASLIEARRVFCFVRDRNISSINVAGNSLATLKKEKWSQAEVNAFVWHVLRRVHKHWKLGAIRSGGQTGADLAGAIAAVALGVPATVLLPRGFLQRTEDGVDLRRSQSFVRQQIQQGAEVLMANEGD